MDFTLKGNNNQVSLSKDTVQKLIDVLKWTECTCVWSEFDNQYIKVNDVPGELVDELIMKLKFAK